MKEKSVVFVIFGGTGDLMKRKLVPAFAQLARNNVLPSGSKIVGIGRKDFDAEEYKRFLSEGLDEKSKDSLYSIPIYYFKSDFTEEGEVHRLVQFLRKEEIHYNLVFYLATSYKFFPLIVHELKNAGLHKHNEGFVRLVFEKPFGSDLNSSNQLDNSLHDAFKEEQIYRIDHYLAKETVLNLTMLRFTNIALQGILNNKYVEKIELIIDEDLGVGNRLEYYNESGALKDMVQNHILQVLSLILMENPKQFTPDSIHNAKVEALNKIQVLPAINHLLGQYESYKKELENANIKYKKTETFARINLESEAKSWKGVKILLRTGKKLSKKYGQIIITFKEDSKFEKEIEGIERNKLVIDIYPKQDIRLILNNRTSGSTKKVHPINLEFCREEDFGPNSPNEYAVLLSEVVAGNLLFFARSDEIKECWKIIEKIEKMKDKIKFVIYKEGSNPEEK